MTGLRDIPGLEGRYAASADGGIWSQRRARYLKFYVVGRGYKAVEIDGRNLKVHRLVALAWLPNPDGKPQVNHIDGDRANNAVCNLEWATPSENTSHAVRTGLFTPVRNRAPFATGERITSKLQPEQVGVIKARLARGDKLKDIAADYDVTPPNISAIKRGITWRYVPAGELS